MLLTEERIERDLLEAGFSGRRTDSLGRVRCYSDGRPTACHGAEHSGGESDRAHAVASERLRRLAESPQSATPADVDKTAKALMRLTKEEAKQLQAKYGLAGKGNKQEQAKAIATEAAKVVGEKEKYARQARAAGLDLKHFEQTADEVHAHATQWREQVRGMLAETKELYRSENGKVLNNLHRAFRGGDYTDIKGFERIARTMAGKYPDLLGAHGYEGDNDSTKAAQALYDLLYAGVPKYTRADAYAEALNLTPAKAGRSRGKAPAEEIPF